MTDGERLDKLERTMQGVQNGQQALRRHIDDRIDTLLTMIERSTNEQPITAPTWAFLLMAASTTIFALIAVVFLADYYFF